MLLCCGFGNIHQGCFIGVKSDWIRIRYGVPVHMVKTYPQYFAENRWCYDHNVFLHSGYESDKSNMSSLPAISCYVLWAIMLHPRPLLARYRTSSRLLQQQVSARMVDNRITTPGLLLIKNNIGGVICSSKWKICICVETHAKCVI